MKIYKWSQSTHANKLNLNLIEPPSVSVYSLSQGQASVKDLNLRNDGFFKCPEKGKSYKERENSEIKYHLLHKFTDIPGL